MAVIKTLFLHNFW